MKGNGPTGWSGIILLAVLFLGGCERMIYGPPPLPASVDPIHAAGTVRVAAGDTLYAIAQRTGVSVAELARINRLAPPYLLRIGRTLRLPKPSFYIVRRGDTLSEIAARYSLSPSRIAWLNRLDDVGYIQAGQRLRLPGGGSLPPDSSATVRRGEGRPTAPPRIRTRPIRPAASAPSIDGPPVSRRGFAWPLRGRVLSTFGRKKTGVHNDGINILAERGTPVRAVSPGHVVYVGEDLAGLGKLLLIRHDRRWTSAYAHNDTVEVRRGQKVAKGQIVARVGASGRVRRSQLHFQLRRNARPVDPNRYLPPRRG